MSSRRLSYAALMVAAALTGVYSESIANFEVLTLVVFGSGVLLGARDGALVGTLTELIYSLLNPYGPAHPLVTLSQVIGESSAGSALPDLPAWWSDDGGAGWSSEAWLGLGTPWVLAGHALGGWSLREPGRAPAAMPSPGLLGDQTPLAWYDSVAVGGGSGAAWRGFGAGLVAAQGLGEIPADGRARAVVDLRSGDFGYDENSLAIERGGSTRWLRGESFRGNGGAVGGLGAVGRHRWGVTGGLGRRGHRLEGTYAERGEAGSLSSGEGQDAKGESGSLEYRYRRRALDLGVRLGRGRDLHKGFERV